MELLIRVPFAIQVALPALVIATVTILALRLRRPRPTFRRLSRQPGFVACAVATVATAITLAEFLVRGYAWRAILHGFDGGAWSISEGGWPPFGDVPRRVLSDSLRGVGYSVLGAWFLLALGRRWRPERGWIDGSGRLIGLAWIGQILVAIALRAAERFS